MILSAVYSGRPVKTLSWVGDLLVDHADLGTTYDQWGGTVKVEGGSMGRYCKASNTVDGFCVLSDTNDSSFMVTKDGKTQGLLFSGDRVGGEVPIFRFGGSVVVGHLVNNGKTVQFIDLEVLEVIKEINTEDPMHYFHEISVSPQGDKLMIREGTHMHAQSVKVYDIDSYLNNKSCPGGLAPKLKELEVRMAFWSDEGDLIVHTPSCMPWKEDSGIPRYATRTAVRTWKLASDRGGLSSPSFFTAGKKIALGRHALTLGPTTRLTDLTTGKVRVVEFEVETDNGKQVRAPASASVKCWAHNRELRKIAVTADYGFLIISY